MAQHDYNLANQSGADFRADLNNALSAIATTNSGATSPSTTFAHQLWVDTANSVLKIRNSANDAWITTGVSITADNTFDINGGTVNGITSFSFSTGSTVTSILDEDDLSSDSATALATQQSIKAYVDSQVGSVDTLAEILLNGNTTGGTNIQFGDNDKAIFGTGSDLQIYHDGSHSYISESGTGNLQIQAQNLSLEDSTGTRFLLGIQGGETRLYNQGNQKVAIQSSGIDVTGEVESDTAHFGTGTGTGTIIADEVVVSGTGSTGITIHSPDANNATLVFGSATDNDYAYIQGYYNSGSPFIRTSILGSEVTKVTSTGIDVTGTVTSDGLTVEGLANATATTAFSTTANTPNASLIIGNSAATAGSGNYKGALGFAKGGTSPQIRSAIVGKQTASSANVQGLAFLVHPNSVAGSLTEALLIKANNDIVFYDDTGTTQGLFWDSSAESLGIGTTSPSAALHISGTSADQIRLERTNHDTFRIGLQSAAGLGFHNVTDNRTDMMIKGDGSIGIGTTSPDALLHLSANTGATLRLESTDTNIAANEVMGAIEWEGNDATTGSSGIAGKIDVITEDATPEYSMRFFTQDNLSGTYELAERMRIKSDGKVGIGTSSPSTTLHVNSGTADAVATFQSSDQFADIKLQDSGGSSFIRQSNGSLIFEADRDNAVSGSALVFQIDGSNVGRFDSSGNFGIGTTSPSATLHTSGGVAAGKFESTGSTYVDIDNGTVTGRLQTISSVFNIGTATAGTSLALKSGNGTEAMRIDSIGNIGIGTSSPNYLLDLEGTGSTLLRLNSTSGAAVLQLSVPDTSSLSDIKFGDSANTSRGQIRYRHTGDSMAFSTAGTEAARIDSSGNVGIGTTSPSNTLVVSDSGGAGLEFIPQTSNDRTTLLSYDRNTSTYQTVDFDGSDIHFNVAGSEKARIDSNGNFGIGTSSPSSISNYKILEVQGDTTTTGGIYYTSSSDNSQKAHYYIGGGVGYLGTQTNHPFAFTTNNTERARIDASGRVGIKNTSPSSQFFNTLVVGNTSGDNGITIQSSATGRGVLAFSDTDAATSGRYDGFINYNHTSQYMSFHTNTGNEHMRIDSNGNILVGTTSTNPQSSSSVEGVQIAPDHIGIGRSGNTALYLNRQTNDGTIVDFRKDGSTVGSIEAATNTNTDISIGSDNVRLLFFTNGSAIVPRAASNASADNTIDLGNTSNRFKDLYLSGGHMNGAANSFTFVSGGNASNAGANILLYGQSHSGSANTTVFRASGTESARIDSSGNLLVGGTSVGADNSFAAGASGNITIARASGDPRTMISFLNGGSTVGKIQTSTTATSYLTSSDARLKEVTGEARGLEVITKLNPVAYNWKADGKADEGLIAQEVKEIVPNAVSGSEDEHYQMDYSKLVTHLVAGMKEQQEQIESLKSEIAKLKGE